MLVSYRLSIVIVTLSPTVLRHIEILFLSGVQTPILGKRENRRGSVIVPFARWVVVSYRLSVVIVALSPTVWQQIQILYFSGGTNPHFGRKGRPYGIGDSTIC